MIIDQLLCPVNRCSTVCRPAWWGTCRSSWTSRLGQSWTKRTLLKLGSCWRRSGGSWSSSPWSSSARRTSCPPWAPKRPWHPLSSGPDSGPSGDQSLSSVDHWYEGNLQGLNSHLQLYKAKYGSTSGTQLCLVSSDIMPLYNCLLFYKWYLYDICSEGMLHSS